MELGFSSYDGGEFLLFYGALIVAAVVAAFWIPGFLRPDGHGHELKDPEALAYLVGGKQRFAESVTAALLARGALRVEGKRLVKTARAEGESRAERDLLRHMGDLDWATAKQRLHDHAAATERDLVSRGVLMPPADRSRLRLLSVAPLVVVFAIGLYRWLAGNAEGEPVGFLTILLVAVLAIALLRLFASNPRTRAGDEVLELALARSQRLRSATTSGETGLAVGLFGTGVLVGTPYAPLHAMRQSGGGADGGVASDGGDGSGGGCGGGGCGGCGG